MPQPTKAQLGKMSNKQLLNKGFVRIPGFTRKDGSKVKAHIRKLTPSQVEGKNQIEADNVFNAKLPDVGGVSAPVQNVQEIVSFDENSYGRQSPDEIVAAEKAAAGGRFGKRRGNVTLKNVKKTGPKEVTYVNEMHNAAGRGGFSKMRKEFENSIKVAIMNSSQDRANIAKGITYKFEYTHAASDSFSDVVFSDKMILEFKANKPKKAKKSTAALRAERLARAKKKNKR